MGSFKFVMPAPHTQLSKVKQMQPKNTKSQTQVPTGLYELFLLTVPIEEVARWQYIKQF